MFGGWFGVCQNGWKDGFCTTLADFFKERLLYKSFSQELGVMENFV
jgi:hypothetical protein